MVPDRAVLLADNTLTGAAWCRAHAAMVDRWLADLLTQAVGEATDGLALVAVGGFGRAELCPQSDIDLYLVHDRRDVSTIAQRIWYPIWDEDLHLGHSVCTVREALALASDDLDTATALLSARHIAGDESLTIELAKRGADQWERKSKRWLTELGATVALRHEKAGEVAFSLEPDLKEGRGGLRDAHALGWAESANRVLLQYDETRLSDAYEVLLGARVELQRITGRASNVLALQEQDEVAAALGDSDADALMGRVAEAARAIAWTSDDTWRRIRSVRRGPLGRVGRRNRNLGDDLALRDGEVVLTDAASPDDPTTMLRAALAAATHGTVIEREALEQFVASTHPLPDPWPAEARDVFVQLLLTGRAATSVVEALDQRGVWARILAEWQHVRALPQRNPYHRYTVDRHLLETVANAANLAERVDRPDLLVVAALLHDLGKGHAGDHTTTGVAIARTLTARMGFPADDADTIVALVQHHLLLAEVATRRELDDPTTSERVAHEIGSAPRLHLLAALSEADSLATGPSAWGPWKADLIHRLVDRVLECLEGQPRTNGPEPFPTAEHLRQLALGGELIDARGQTLTVITRDRPGVFSRVAGVLALRGLDVVSASAYSSDDGRALAVFHVTDGIHDHPPWDRVTRDLRLALDGRLALGARLAERARTYRRRGSVQGGSAVSISVNFDVDASAEATVIDVHAPDGIGVLYRITRALAELDLDIRSARVQTLGPSVVDAFYVRDRGGEKLSDPEVLAEIERAILHSLEA